MILISGLGSGLEWLTQPLSGSIQHRALLAAGLAAVTTAIVGTWVVLRGLAFMGDALSHGVLPGVALASLLGMSLAVGALVGAAVMAILVGFVSKRTAIGQDTSIGLAFVGMLALGVMMLAGRRDAEHITELLFGNLGDITNAELILQAGVAAVALAATVLFYRPFLALSLNPPQAELLGMRPGLTHYVMLGAIALAVVSSFGAVGTLLVSGLLVAPAATAAVLHARSVPRMMLTAVLLGLVAVVIGQVVSFHAATPQSATMAGTAVGMFFLALVLLEPFARRRHV